MADVLGKEGKRLRGERSVRELEIGETIEERETEFKIIGSWLTDLKPKLRTLGAKKIFEGINETTWFKNGLPRGVSARVRKSIEKKGKPKYTWTIKCDPTYTNGASARGLRDKFETTGREADFESAKAELIKGLVALGVDIPSTNSKSSLAIIKNRISHMFPRGEHKGLRLDFDTITSVNGIAVRPLELMEIEDTSDESVGQKENRTMNCAIDLGFDETHFDTEFAYMSTEQLLLRTGYIFKSASVSPGVTETNS